MTTAKHVVDDDLFGEISRRTWELQRRVLEGSLDPHVTLARLQALIQNNSSKEIDFETELFGRIRELSRAGRLQEALLAAAMVLQVEAHGYATSRKGQAIPHAGALDLIMRVVLAILEIGDDGDQGDYINYNLRQGIAILADELGKKSPQFVRKDAAFAVPLANVRQSKL